MLADAGVYGFSLAAADRSSSEQRQAAVLSGRLQIVLAIWVLLDGLRRTAFGTEPISALMVGIGVLALLPTCSAWCWCAGTGKAAYTCGHR